MDDQKSIDSLMFQLAFQTRGLAQKKDEINQQIKMCRADIAEKKSNIETTKISIQRLEGEITPKQNTVKYMTDSTKSMKKTNSLLLQYEKTLKAELDTRRDNCNQDMCVHEERFASYKKVFQQHKEHYCQNPLAKKLLTIQAEKEGIECRIKDLEDEMTMKQKEMANIEQAVNPSSTGNTPESVSGQLTMTETEKQLDKLTEDIHSSIDISSIHLTHTKDVHNVSGGEVHTGETQERNMEEDAPSSYPPAPQEESHELWVRQESAGNLTVRVMLFLQNNCSTQSRHQVSIGTRVVDQWMRYALSRCFLDQEEHSAMSETEDGGDKGREERVTMEEEQVEFSAEEEDKDGTTAFTQSSPPSASCQTPPTRMKVVPSTPTFSLNGSPGSSPSQGTSDSKSPAFSMPFSMNPDASTSSFSGFGFDMGSVQEEDSPFTFTSSYFSNKKSSESKSPSGFLFDQTERSEDDFQFSFASKSPESTVGSKEKPARDAFPFSFNFGKF